MPPFAITTEAGTFAVTEWSAPDRHELGRADRTCRVGIAWTPDGVAAEAHGCPHPVAADALDTVRRWAWTAPAGFAGHADLGEVWFVYPFEAGDVVRVFVRQSDGHDLTLPAGVDAVPYAIRAWSFVRYPAEAHAAGVPDVVCVVDVQADARGITREVVAKGCADPFRAAAEDAIGDWRFVPPLVGGEPIPSALTLSATFSPEAPASPVEGPPADHRRDLWDDGAFDQLTRDERLWFIRATLLGPTLRDLGPGHVRVDLPDLPDLGARLPPDWGLDVLSRGDGPPVPPIPDHPPLFVLGRRDHRAVEVYELGLPDPVAVAPEARGKRCELLVQVDGERRVVSWAEACDPDARAAAVLAADGWVLRHDGPPVRQERVQFRATVAFDEAGAATVLLDADLVRTPLDALPAAVHTWREPTPIQRVPPRLPRDVVLPNETCRMAVDVDPRGRPARIEVLECPAGFEDRATRAVRRWRWRPAEEDGAPVEGRTVVTIRFGS